MSLNNMVWASASTPYYFKPSVIDDNVYVSGDNLAISPAMYVTFYANDYLAVPYADIIVVSVGATHELADLIEADGGGSLLTWSSRLSTLAGKVNKHTMDGVINSLLAKHNHVLNKFEIPKSRDWGTDFYDMSGKRLPSLKNLANEMIDTNLDDITHMIDEIISERFSTLYSC